MARYPASFGTVIQGRFLHGKPVIQAQPALPRAAVPASAVPAAAVPLQPKIPVPVPAPKAKTPQGLIQQRPKPAPPPLRPMRAAAASVPPIQPKQLIPGKVAQPQINQPVSAPHIPKIQPGVKPTPPPLRPLTPQVSGTAQPGTAAQRQTVTGLAVQSLPSGEALQLPPRLSNFGNLPGKPLPDAVQQKMEAFFKTDFSDVRIHVGPQAASIGALAFTQGNNLHFAPGQYNPTTLQGRASAH